MNPTPNILSSLPLFGHCLEEELLALQRIGTMSSVKKGHRFDLKKLNSLTVIVNGIFEIESAGRTDVVYLAPGTFFGAVPFTENRPTGRITALVDSTVLIFGAEDLYRFFLTSYKSLRGYLKTVGRMGFGISDAGREYLGGETKIITIYAPAPRSGASFLSSLMGESLAAGGRTLVMDLSLGEGSVFDYFERKITAPLAQRTAGDGQAERMVDEWIERVEGGPDLLNVAHGSKVGVNPGILAPLLFVLSRTYRYILIDCGDDDPALRDSVFSLSDRIFTLVRARKETRGLFEVFDSRVREGQRVYYLLNEYFAGTAAEFEGGLVLPAFDGTAGSGARERVRGIVKAGGVSTLVSLVTRRRSALVLETNLLPSIFIAGFLDALRAAKKEFDLFYASAYSYIVLALYLLSGEKGQYRRRLEQFFSGDRIGRLLGITFPTGHVFKHGAAVKLAGEICGDGRLEMFRELPAVMLCRGGESARRIFTTGYLRDMVAASFCLYPLFEDVAVQGEGYHSGYPDARVRVEDLFRTDIDETVHVSVSNAGRMNYRGGTIIDFFTRYLELAGTRSTLDESVMADTRFVLEVSEREVRVAKILDQSRELAESMMKKAGW